MEKVKVILNPAAGRGFGARVASDLQQFLHKEGLDFDLELTEGPWHAAELAEVAACDGFESVVAAGGDGTANEVINGLMRAAERGAVATMGVLPAGSGGDFAGALGIPSDWREACRRLSTAQTKSIDVGRVTVGDKPSRYFGNVVGVGFDGAVLVETLKIRRLRGLILYLLAVLKTVFLNFEASLTTIEYDDQRMVLPALMVSVANGTREGGGFLIAPQSELDDGFFDLCIARDTSRLMILRLIPRFIKGTHVDHRLVTMARAKSVVVSSEDKLIAHVDGEVLCTDARRIEMELLPERLRVRV